MEGVFRRDARNCEREIFIYDVSLHNVGLEGREPYTIARGRWGGKEFAALTYTPSDGTMHGLTDEEQELVIEMRDGNYVEEAHLLSTEERKFIDRQRDPKYRKFPLCGLARYFNGDMYEGDFKKNENSREYLFDGDGKRTSQ